LTSLADFWKIEDPTWGYGGNVFQLDYVFNDMVEDSMISWTYWDKDCQTGGNKLTSEGLGYTMNMTRATSELGDGSGTRAYQLSLNPNADVKDNTDIYIGDLQDGGNNWYGSLTLCARASLSTENDVEVNFIENVITVRYEFSDGFFTIDDVKVDRPVGKLNFVLYRIVSYCIVSFPIEVRSNNAKK